MLKRLPIFIFLFIIFYIYFKDEVFEQKVLTVGSSLPTTGIIKTWGEAVTSGANSYFNYANENNLIKNRKIEFLIYDDKYEPELTLENVNKLIYQDKVFALFGLVGTPTVKRVLPILYDENIPLFSAFTGASFLRNNQNENFINFRSSYNEEIEALMNYITKIKKSNKIAVFYQNDDYGEEGYILAKRNLTLSAERTYKRNTLSIRHAIHEIEAAKPEAIVLVGSYKPTARFIEKVKEHIPSKMIFCPISFVNADALIGELHGQGENILFSQTIPSYDDFYSKEAVEYLKNLTFYYPEEKPSLVSYESYLAAKSVVTALKAINGAITPSKFLDKLKNLSPKTLDNIPLKYNHAQLLNQVYLSNYVNGKFEIIQKYEY